jgi:outer membrane usher protein
MAARRRGFWMICLWSVATVGQAQVPPTPTPPSAAPILEAPIDRQAPATYYLDVRIDDWPSRLVASFRDDGGRLSLSVDQFKGLGFRLDDAWVTQEGEARRVYLDSVPNLSWRVDPLAQTIDIVAPFEILTPNALAVSPRPERVEAQSGRGMLLSYDLFGEWAADPDAGSYGRSLSTTLEGRLFSSRHTLVSTGSLAWSGGDRRAIRYETYFAVDDQDKARTLRIGDSTTYALGWSRNLRFGGVQYRRNYGLRPDIVTTPLPEFVDGVTTPSVLDLYINGVKRYSNEVRPGAFALGHLPVLTGANNVTIVLTDIDGRERTVNLPFYMNTRLLEQGLTDFSFEAGAVREDYGLKSAEYGQAFLSGVWRRGLSGGMTLETHGEAARGLVMGGFSVWTPVLSRFAVGGALAVSNGPDGESGTLWAVGFDRTANRLSVSARHEESSAGFRDVADLSDEAHVRSRDTATIGLNAGPAGTLNLAYVSETRADGTQTPVATASYGADLFQRRARLSATAFSVLNQKDQWGVGFTILIPLGQHGLVSGGAQRRREGGYYEAEARGSTMDNRLIWQLRDVEGPVPARSAELRWDGSTLDGRVKLLDDEKTTAAQIEVAQSLVLFEGRLFVADRVDEAFAVVQVGRNAGVEVFRENQPVGTHRRRRSVVREPSARLREQQPVGRRRGLAAGRRLGDHGQDHRAAARGRRARDLRRHPGALGPRDADDHGRGGAAGRRRRSSGRSRVPARLWRRGLLARPGGGAQRDPGGLARSHLRRRHHRAGQTWRDSQAGALHMRVLTRRILSSALFASGLAMAAVGPGAAQPRSGVCNLTVFELSFGEYDVFDVNRTRAVTRILVNCQGGLGKIAPGSSSAPARRRISSVAPSSRARTR